MVVVTLDEYFYSIQDFPQIVNLPLNGPAQIIISVPCEVANEYHCLIRRDMLVPQSHQRPVHLLNTRLYRGELLISAVLSDIRMVEVEVRNHVINTCPHFVSRLIKRPIYADQITQKCRKVGSERAQDLPSVSLILAGGLWLSCVVYRVVRFESQWL